MTTVRSVDVTLGIPTRNSGPYLDELFASIARLTVLPQSILFSDNASTDDTVARIERFRVENPGLFVRISLNETDLGIAGNYNRIVERAFDTTWLHIVDSDDFLLDDYYGRLEPALSADTDMIVTSMRSSSRPVNAYTSLFEHAMKGAGLRSVPSFVQILGSASCRSSLVYRTSRLKSRPFYDPQFDGSDIIHAEDFMARHLYWPEAKVFYRIHPARETSRIASSRERSRADSSRYLSYVRGLPLGRRLSFTADFLLRKKVAAFLRRN